MTTLTKNQFKTFGPVEYTENGTRYRIKATVRHDDRCGNGHNTLSVTGEIDRFNDRYGRWEEDSGGCIHDSIARHFPELIPAIPYHLCSTDGPLHYVANSLYWAGMKGWTNGGRNDPPNLKYFRSTAIWPDATADDMAGVSRETLEARLPDLMERFREIVESLGFAY